MNQQQQGDNESLSSGIFTESGDDSVARETVEQIPCDNDTLQRDVQEEEEADVVIESEMAQPGDDECSIVEKSNADHESSLDDSEDKSTLQQIDVTTDEKSSTDDIAIELQETAQTMDQQEEEQLEEHLEEEQPEEEQSEEEQSEEEQQLGEYPLEQQQQLQEEQFEQHQEDYTQDQHQLQLQEEKLQMQLLPEEQQEEKPEQQQEEVQQDEQQQAEEQVEDFNPLEEEFGYSQQEQPQYEEEDRPQQEDEQEQSQYEEEDRPQQEHEQEQPQYEEEDRLQQEDEQEQPQQEEEQEQDEQDLPDQQAQHEKEVWQGQEEQQQPQQDDQQEEQKQDDESESGDVFIANHVSSPIAGDDDDAFRMAVEQEEDKVLNEFGMTRPDNDGDAASAADNASNSIFADSYNGILIQLDTSQMADKKASTPETYDNVYGDGDDDFDDDENHAGSFQRDPAFPYPTKIVVRHVAPSSHSPTKDSTSSPPPPKPFLTPRRLNLLVAGLCFILVASVGVAVGSFLAQQAGKTTPQSSIAVPNVDQNTSSPMASPVSPPTTAPTATFVWNEGDCMDHPYKKFNINERFGEQDCAFLQDRPAQRARMCLPENEGYRWCPVTCGACQESAAPAAAHSDAPSPVPSVTGFPTSDDGVLPTAVPIATTVSPTASPTFPPTMRPTLEPTVLIATTAAPTKRPARATATPTARPARTMRPTRGVVTSSPTATPNVPPTAAPTSSSNVRSVILAALTDSSVNLDDMTTPAGEAFDWVSRSSTRNNLPDWRIPQQFALAGLAYSTGVDKWTQSGSWLENGNECSWDGITCDSRGRVTGIQLRDAGLQGNLFPELYMLSNSLITLNAGQNKMKGRIPNELGLLQQLRLLQIDRNEFSGSIPRSLGGLRNMQVLNLEVNSLTGTLPAAMERMPLRHFRFHSNELTGSIFDSWCQRDNLQLEADCNEIACPCCAKCF